jgi:hypothetical protein
VKLFLPAGRRIRAGVAGAAGQPLTRQAPVGNWTIQLENTDELTASFQVGFIQDIVLVFTVAAATPAWP